MSGLNYWDGIRVGESKAMRLAERAYDRGVLVGLCVGIVFGAFAVWFVIGWLS